MARYFGVPLRNGLPIGLGSTIAINRAVRQALPPPSGDALLQEDGTSYFELQDGTGYILLEGLMPTLWLDFQNSTSLDSRITFTRASNATYFNSAGVLTTAGSGVARFDYNPSTLQPRGLLIEEQRTNLLVQSQTFQTTWATNAASISADATTGPDGLVTADKLVEDATTAEHFVRQTSVSVSSSTSYAATVYAKAAERTTCRILCSTTGPSSGFVAGSYDLSAGTASGTGASIQSIGNGWYRCVLTITSGAAQTLMEYRVQLQTGSYAGNGTSGIFIWGAQLEAGAFATSYIPTTTTALTRNADVASMTGTNFSSWYNQTEGSLFGQFSLISSLYTSGVALDVGAGGAFGTTEYLAWNGTSWVLAPGVAPINVSSSVATTASAKVIAGIKANDSVIAGNGLIGSVDTSCAVPASATTLTIGKGGWSGSGNYINGWIARIAYYPVRLPGSTLQALTA